MAAATLQQQAEAINDQFPEDIEISIEEIESRLQVLVEEYHVPVNEARRTVTNHYLHELGLEFDDLDIGGSSDRDEPTLLAAVTSPNEWITVVAKVVQLWEARSDAIGQVGLLGDESGTLKFTAWAKSSLPSLDEGAVYRLENVVTDEYEGRYTVNLNSSTTITEVDEEIEIGGNTASVEGALVDVQSGSGLIKRCPEADCTRVVQNGRCAEHGEVDGEFDMRIKAIFDDGHDVYEVIFNQDATEALTGITLDEAKQLAMDALDTEVVADEMTAMVVGQYYRVSGPTIGRYLLVEEAEPLVEPLDPEAVLSQERLM